MSKTILITILMSGILILGCNDNKNPKKLKSPTVDKNLIKAQDLKVDSKNLSHLKAVIKTVHGNLIFKFYPKNAPNTVTRIIQLAQKGFYDGLTFHRVVPNFVIQGGDPQGNGTGGTGVKLKAEFNKIQHIKGTVAMARAQDVDSADSQFYIALSTLSHLDNKYTVFGQVIEGLDLLNKIVKGDKILSMVIKQ